MITNLILSLGLSFAVGLNGIRENHNNYVDNTPTHTVNINGSTITIEYTDLNNYTWTNLANFLNEVTLDPNNTFTTDIHSYYIYYGNVQYVFDDLAANDAFTYAAAESTLDLNLAPNMTNSYKFALNSNYGEFENDIEWDLTDFAYATDIINAIQLDITANEQEPASMGNSIISAIVSGLGLISDLASEFLVGFSTLFWNANNSTLTSFGTFALVMLGVAITMAVISLVLNLIRGNTGA